MNSFLDHQSYSCRKIQFKMCCFNYCFLYLYFVKKCYRRSPSQLQFWISCLASCKLLIQQDWLEMARFTLEMSDTSWCFYLVTHKYLPFLLQILTRPQGVHKQVYWGPVLASNTVKLLILSNQQCKTQDVKSIKKQRNQRTELKLNLRNRNKQMFVVFAWRIT